MTPRHWHQGTSNSQLVSRYDWLPAHSNLGIHDSPWTKWPHTIRRYQAFYTLTHCKHIHLQQTNIIRHILQSLYLSSSHINVPVMKYLSKWYVLWLIRESILWFIFLKDFPRCLLHVLRTISHLVNKKYPILSAPLLNVLWVSCLYYESLPSPSCYWNLPPWSSYAWWDVYATHSLRSMHPILWVRHRCKYKFRAVGYTEEYTSKRENPSFNTK